MSYQAVVSRFYARTGWYQSGGAFGFRDQLQDALIFLESDPLILRRHVLRCAAHQFPEGDVLHWWHPGTESPGRSAKGVRTACSDDHLWLCFAAAAYLKKTGDLAVLNVPVPFLSDEGGPVEKGDRYFAAGLEEAAPLSRHLDASVELLIRRGTGPRSLARICGGDWNDGFDRLGGESVWLSEFAALTLHRIAPYLSPEVRRKSEPFVQKLLNGISGSFNGSWFARAFREDGTAVGSDLSLESACGIDLLPQAFAAFLYCEDGLKHGLEENKEKKALQCAYEILVLENERVVRLFTKPFEATSPSPGYIQNYAAGVRENGGQYTHAAVWFALALLRFGRKTGDEEMIRLSEKVSDLIDPTNNLSSKAWRRYRREPYVLCGDVYDAPGAQGQGGWSWYTGAAAWYYRYLREKGRK